VNADSYGEFNDWIEIYNSGTETINLAGFFLADTTAKSFAYQIPTGNDSTIISPGEFFLFWADNDTNQGVFHLNFKLSGNGEQVVLFDTDTNIIDSITYDVQLSNISYGRQNDGEDIWTFFPDPTPAATNNPGSIFNNTSQTINVFPNPATDFIKISGLQSKKHIRIYNIFGECKYSNETMEESTYIDISKFQAGLYIIEELGSENRAIGKFIIK
jgi:hypothetical protein